MAMNFYLGTVGRGASAALLGLMMACRTDAEVLFTQPALSGVTDNLYVLTRPPVGSWSLLALQTNPYSKNGKFVPSLPCVVSVRLLPYTAIHEPGAMGPLW